MKLGASRAVRQAKDVRPVSSASRYGFRTLAESTRLPTPCWEVRFGHSDRHMPRKQRQYSLLCSHNLTDSFCRKYFPLISIQIAGWCGPLDERNLLPQAQLILFHAFAHSFARRKNSTILFSFCCALLRENTRVGGMASLQTGTARFSFVPPASCRPSVGQMASPQAALAQIHHRRWFSASSQRYLSVTASVSSGLLRLSSMACEDRHEIALWHRACLIEARRLLRGAL